MEQENPATAEGIVAGWAANELTKALDVNRRTQRLTAIATWSSIVMFTVGMILEQTLLSIVAFIILGISQYLHGESNARQHHLQSDLSYCESIVEGEVNEYDSSS